jgi:IS5 family transposase
MLGPWHPIADGAGIPLALVIDGANRHDMKLLGATLDGWVASRPEPTQEQQHLCLDAAYDSTPVYHELLARQYQPHVRSRGEERRVVNGVKSAKLLRSNWQNRREESKNSQMKSFT